MQPHSPSLKAASAGVPAGQGTALLSEEQSAKLAGVSVETIRHYAGYGLLERVESGTSVAFREQDIRKLFHASQPLETTRRAQEIASGTSAAQSPADTEPVDSEPNQREPLSAQVSVECLSNSELVASPEDKQISAVHQLHLLEANRSLREQLEQLRNERDWLRTRLEKLETRSEREQMLVISESETIRSFIKQQQRKKGFWSFALPWLRSDER